MPVAASITVLFCGFALGAVAWPLARWRQPARGIGISLIAVGLLALPWLTRGDHVVARVIATLSCCGVFVPKIADLAAQPAFWREQRLWGWLIFLPDTGHLVGGTLSRAETNPQTVRWLLRGIVEVTLGALLLTWFVRHELHTTSFWRQHAVKIAAAYLIGFDGGFVLLCGLWRAFGVRVIDAGRDPILATTPADFWRRYNREAGRFFRLRVYQPLMRGGKHRKPTFAILCVFLINGLGHEYLAWVLVGKIQGYQLAFFTLHGVATAMTYRLRPTGTVAHIGRVLTIAFGFFTSALFFASVDQIMGW